MAILNKEEAKAILHAMHVTQLPLPVKKPIPLYRLLLILGKNRGVQVLMNWIMPLWNG